MFFTDDSSRQALTGSFSPVAGHYSSSPDVASFSWLLKEFSENRAGALLTVAGVDGGAPRPVGSHMAVVSGERFHGYLSGGCVEPAIAREAEAVIAARQDRVIRFGKGSPFFDIRFPCGGGVDVLVHTGLTTALVEEVLDRFARRKAFTLAFMPGESRSAIVETPLQTGWCGTSFHRRYLPATRLVLVGRGPELETTARLAAAVNYDIVVMTPDAEMGRRLADLPVDLTILDSPRDVPALPADPWTATVLLFHEREWEDPILAAALAAPGFYIGALGSQRTHAGRRDRLLAAGHSPALVNRISGPVGIIPQAREPETLALSVLGEVAIRRREHDGRSFSGG
ncbi:XdhC family protein [Acidomonas methanolica]|uniref:XdhC family protein n=1 Tax=Acidomonas methanolica TaxID=437 RepID=UPI000A56AD22|nr:XdhC family protein [Acidomonas methanolica]MBU2654061.1 XdhC family protein [Acidomonas methanolica]